VGTHWRRQSATGEGTVKPQHRHQTKGLVTQGARKEKMEKKIGFQHNGIRTCSVAGPERKCGKEGKGKSWGDVFTEKKKLGGRDFSEEKNQKNSGEGFRGDWRESEGGTEFMCDREIQSEREMKMEIRHPAEGFWRGRFKPGLPSQPHKEQGAKRLGAKLNTGANFRGNIRNKGEVVFLNGGRGTRFEKKGVPRLTNGNQRPVGKGQW